MSISKLCQEFLSSMSKGWCMEYAKKPCFSNLCPLNTNSVEIKPVEKD